MKVKKAVSGGGSILYRTARMKLLQYDLARCRLMIMNMKRRLAFDTTEARIMFTWGELCSGTQFTRVMSVHPSLPGVYALPCFSRREHLLSPPQISETRTQPQILFLRYRETNTLIKQCALQYNTSTRETLPLNKIKRVKIRSCVGIKDQDTRKPHG